MFADGFAGVDTIASVNDARFRPMGLASGPDGSLYISDSRKGRIWRIQYKGDKDLFSSNELATMNQRKNLPYLRTPDEHLDILEEDGISEGESLYNLYCSPCHQPDGKGSEGRFPPISMTDWVNKDKNRLIGLILNGMAGVIEVNGNIYNNIMPSFSYLDDKEVASLLSYVRQSFGNNSDALTSEEVAAMRNLQPMPDL